MQLIQATGRRKTSVARVRLLPGAGEITVNDREAKQYFQGTERILRRVFAPLKLTNTENQFKVVVNVRGGGIVGQAGATVHGLARALEKYNHELRPILKKAGFLTRDSRMVERKKYGQAGARARFQFSKR